VLARPGELLALLFDALEDPVHLRLTRWFLGSGRATSAESIGLQDHGLRLIADQIAATTPGLARAKIELALLTAVSAAYGYATGKNALSRALGRQPGPDLDLGVQRTIATMVQAYLRSDLE
jgi:hypothetical protein